MATSVHLDRAKIHVIEGRLIVRHGFAPGDENRYSNALFNYLSMGCERCEIDLSRVDGISKPAVDMTVSFAQFAGDMGRAVAVVANPSVAEALRQAGFEKVGRIRTVRG